jgi:K(+)-stimulated pyrophosphate-energized sodium pump
MVFVGFLIGGTIPWMFSSLAIKAVSRTAADIVLEVRRQFRVPGVMEGTVKPDYARPWPSPPSPRRRSWSTWPGWPWQPLSPWAGCCKSRPGRLPGRRDPLWPAAGGVHVQRRRRLGQRQEDVEDEPRDLEHNLGKGSERHKASVVGDTVGDPLKDTAGPALNPMIKVINLISLILAPMAPIIVWALPARLPRRRRRRRCRGKAASPSRA